MEKVVNNHTRTIFVCIRRNNLEATTVYDRVDVSSRAVEGDLYSNCPSDEVCRRLRITIFEHKLENWLLFFSPRVGKNRGFFCILVKGGLVFPKIIGFILEIKWTFRCTSGSCDCDCRHRDCHSLASRSN